MGAANLQVVGWSSHTTYLGSQPLLFALHGEYSFWQIWVRHS